MRALAYLYIQLAREAIADPRIQGASRRRAYEMLAEAGRLLALLNI